MKNKNLKTLFTGLTIAIAIILIALTNFWANLGSILNATGQVHSFNLSFCLWTANENTGVIALNGKLAWVFIVLLIAGAALTITNFIMFTIPNRNKISFAFDILTILGFVMTFIGMFLPCGLNAVTELRNIRISATQVFMYVGSPLALAMSFVNSFVVGKTDKNEVPPQNTSIPSQPTNNI